MKKSYKKILVFQLIIFSIFILNSFVSNILGGYNFIILLALSLVIFKFFFGFEKSTSRHTKDTIIEVLIFIMIFFILFYLFGLVIGFARASNYYNWYGFKTFIIPIVLTIILKEILRYNMLRKCDESILLRTIVFVLFTFLDLTEVIYYSNFTDNYNSFIFVALSFLPAISRNLVANYISIRAGYKPVIMYLLIMGLYAYLIPIIPNPNEYITSIIQLILPVLLWSRLRAFFSREEDSYVGRDYKKTNIPLLIIPIFVTIVFVYFTSGYFHYYALAVASGSMEPTIHKGDVVIVEKTNDCSKLKEGQVLVYKHNKVVIIHRIIRIIKVDGEYHIYTKGDANEDEDNVDITAENVVGTANLTIPYIGYPTVWLNEQ